MGFLLFLRLSRPFFTQSNIWDTNGSRPRRQQEAMKVIYSTTKYHPLVAMCVHSPYDGHQ